jgi:hypothetical protein
MIDETKINISRPIEEVFPFMTDPKYQTQYDSGLISLTYEPEGTVRTGTRITEFRKAMGR